MAGKRLNLSAGRQRLPLPASNRSHCSEPTMFRSSELNTCSPSGRLFRAALGAHTMLLQDTV
jgi:hypothetical protein